MWAYTMKGELIEFELRDIKSKYIGNTYTTNKGEKFKVLGSLDIKNKQSAYLYYLIEFEDGTQIVVHNTVVRSKDNTNPNTPSLLGVGYIGQGKHKPSINNKHTTWKGMLRRCYNTKYQESCKSYIECTVDPRWHNFQNFCEDIQYLEGYEDWKENNRRFAYALDKDIKIEGNKVYSKDTCMFVTTKENALAATLTGKTYEATNIKTGERIVFYNQKEFARKHDLNRAGIWGCIVGRFKQYKGWTFKIIEK